ncbi:hypothetical protein ACP70R_012107 [Stipagrostis hirtigluma subsp. patula]
MAKGGGGGGQRRPGPSGESAEPERCRTCNCLVRLLRRAHADAEALELECEHLQMDLEFLRRDRSESEHILLDRIEQMRRFEAGRERILKAAAAEQVGAKEREARIYQELYELIENDEEDLRTLIKTLTAENTELKAKLKEVESHAVLSENNVDHQHSAKHSRTEIRKLKQAYRALKDQKDKEVSALCAEKKFAWNQLNTMERDYITICKKKDKEAKQADEAAKKLQQEVDELKAAAQKKDDEIDRLRAESSHAKEKILGLEDELQQMRSLVKGKDDKTGKLKCGRPKTRSSQKKGVTETHRKSRSEGPVLREKSSNSQVTPLVRKVKTPKIRALTAKEMQSGSRENSHTFNIEERRQHDTSQKRKRGSSLSHWSPAMFHKGASYNHWVAHALLPQFQGPKADWPNSFLMKSLPAGVRYPDMPNCPYAPFSDST